MEKLGKYALIRKLATGGMAEVFLARSEGPMGFAKQMVVKRILPQYGEDQQFVQMFLGEATIAAQMNHPNVVSIFDFGEAGGRYFIAMEYIDGPNLRGLDNALRNVDMRLPLSVAARVISLAAEGLHYAHELKDERGHAIDLVHRDISPDNIMISSSGAVKVVDFGIAKATTGVHQTRSGLIKGKLAYMPPEQLAREQLDRRTDIFSLGVVLFELVAGQMPFDSTSEVSVIQAIMGNEPLRRARSIAADLPQELDRIIAKCLEKKQGDRYASMKDLQEDLERFISSQGKPVTSGDLSTLVRTYCPPSAPDAPTMLNRTPSKIEDEDDGGMGATSPRMPSQARPGPDLALKVEDAPLPPADDSSLQKTHVSHQNLPQAKPTSKLPIIGGAVLALVGLVAAGFALRPAPVVPTVVDAGVVAVPVIKPLEPVDAGAPPVAVVAEVDAGPAAPPEEVDAGAVAVVDAGHAPTPVAAVAKSAKLELRIRPFAVVYVDGKLLGETPLPPQTLSVGPHKLRLVNEELHKDLNVDVTVPPTGTVFKINLND